MPCVKRGHFLAGHEWNDVQLFSNGYWEEFPYRFRIGRTTGNCQAQLWNALHEYLKPVTQIVDALCDQASFLQREAAARLLRYRFLE